MSSGPGEAIERLYRARFGAMVASLVSYFGLDDLQLAEDLVQETFAAALVSWEKELPKKPEAWLYRVCRNKALNHLQSSHQQKTSAWMPDSMAGGTYLVPETFTEDEIQHERLRLLFAFCDPRLPVRAQVILSLRVVSGFRPTEIANGLSMTEAAVSKTLTRTRSLIRQHHLQLKVPYRMQSHQRLTAVHQVLYLMFTEAYRSSWDISPIRKDLCLETLRLTQALFEARGIANAETAALFALMLFQVARMPGRTDASSLPLDLAEQDRSLWDGEIIRRATGVLRQARSAPELSRFHLEAAVASVHCAAQDFEDTDWDALQRLYDLMWQRYPSEPVRLNRAIAIGFAQGSEQGLEALQKVPEEHRAAQWFLAVGRFEEKRGHWNAARDAYLDALGHPILPQDKHMAELRLQKLRKQIP